MLFHKGGLHRNKSGEKGSTVKDNRKLKNAICRAWGVSDADAHALVECLSVMTNGEATLFELLDLTREMIPDDDARTLWAAGDIDQDIWGNVCSDGIGHNLISFLTDRCENVVALLNVLRCRRG